jgi:drug/metabolite transporter (DMT)-like permease
MGEIAALISAVSWACTSVVLTSLSGRTPPVVISALRLSAATLVLPFILLASGQAHELGQASAWTIFSIAGSGLLGYGLGDTMYIRVLSLIGLQRAFPISSGLFISLTVAGGVIVLGESFTWGLPAGAALIAAGVYLIVIPGKGDPRQPVTVVAVAEPALASFEELPPRTQAGQPWLAYALLLGVGVAWATATIWLAGGRGDLHAVSTSAIRAAAGALGLMLFGLTTQPAAMREPFRNRRKLGGIVLAGLMGTAFGSLMYVYAVEEAGAARTAVLNATAPLMGLPLSIIFLGEHFTRRIALGTTLCVAGIALVVSKHVNPRDGVEALAARLRARLDGLELLARSVQASREDVEAVAHLAALVGVNHVREHVQLGEIGAFAVALFVDVALAGELGLGVAPRLRRLAAELAMGRQLPAVLKPLSHKRLPAASAIHRRFTAEAKRGACAGNAAEFAHGDVAIEAPDAGKRASAERQPVRRCGHHANVLAARQSAASDEEIGVHVCGDGRAAGAVGGQARR